MADVLNAYVAYETNIPNYDFDYMNGAVFVKVKKEIYPIPQVEIYLSVDEGISDLKENPGY